MAKGRPDRPQTRAERRRAAKERRGRLMLGGAVVVAVLVIVAWFPTSALYHQHQQLASATSHLDQLRSQDDALQQERERLTTPAEVARIARQQYQLVLPGQQAYQVLTGAGSVAGSGAGEAGLHVPVTPSAESELPAGSVSSGSQVAGSGGSTTAAARSGSAHGGSARSTGSTHDSGGSGSPSSLGGRILQTLEFWR